MKVLIIASLIDRSETFLFRMLRESGIYLEFIGHPSDPVCESFQSEGMSVTRLPFKSRVDLGAVRMIRNKLKGGNFDIIHAFTNRCLSNALLASRGIPVKHIGYRGTIGHLSRWDPASWLTYLNPRVDRIVCVSDAVRQYLLSMRIPPSRLATIYKGHDVSWYGDGEPPSLSEFGIPSEAFIVGFTGDMRPVKGVDVLIQSALHLREFPKIHFLLIGQVRDRKIEKLAREEKIRDMIHFTGFRKDAPALMRAANVFVMPSIGREGLPRGVIEAMSQRVPAIVSDVGGMPELVKDNECGLVVPPGDPEALANAIRFFAEDPARAKEFGDRAYERIKNHFNIQTTIKETIELYKEVISNQ